MDWLETFKEWFLSLGEKYNVNPYIFGGIYVGAIPFFFSLFKLDNQESKKKEKINCCYGIINGLVFYICLLISSYSW